MLTTIGLLIYLDKAVLMQLNDAVEQPSTLFQYINGKSSQVQVNQRTKRD